MSISATGGSNTTLLGYSRVLLCSNVALSNGAAIHFSFLANILISENSYIFIQNNQAMQQGGAIYLENNSTAIFQSLSYAEFQSNKAILILI